MVKFILNVEQILQHDLNLIGVTFIGKDGCCVAVEAGEFRALDGGATEDGREVFLRHGENGLSVESEDWWARTEFLNG